ncbi:MAG: ABC transporter substrate-binding protein, partial [bacterium]|nr:ABC transporter substrate-binding protein [Candidatus Limimorpha equi]
MKKIISIFFAAMLFVSCSREMNSDENLAIFKYNESAGILTLDPIYAKDLPHIWACNQLYNSLVAFDDSMNIVPMIAKSWEISEDGLTYTFHLRNDVFFHESEAYSEPRCVTANDVV